MKFQYPTKKDVQVLKGVTINVKSNTVVAIVGTSGKYQISWLNLLNIGCGKSSVMKLIERFYDPAEGRLLYNDIDLKDIDSKWFH